ncbi:MAG: hypothetical protein MOGMAGMI_02188 [Candidatus Omnitrophica bacterium]|nr:hypothetical protein [Candidatus Omnitrophota bacterium]
MPDVRERWALPVVLALLAGLVVFVFHYTVEIPRADEWSLILLYDRPGVRWTEVWQVYLDQSHFLLPYSILRLVASCTDGSILARSLLSVSTACLTYAAVARVLRGSAASGPRWVYPLSLIGTASGTFAIHQWGGWLWGVQFCVYLCLLASVWGWSVLIVEKRPVRRVLYAVLCGVVSTYAFVGGLFYWPACAVVLVVLGDRDRTTWLWIAGAATVTIALYILPQAPLNGGGPVWDRNSAEFFLRYVGGWFGSGVSVFWGAAGLISIPVLLSGFRPARMDEARRGVLALSSALIVFVLSGGISTAVMRSEQLGAEGGSAAQYVVYSCWIWTALLWVGLIESSDKAAPTVRRVLAAGCAAVILVLPWTGLGTVFREAETSATQLRVARWLLMNEQWHDLRLGRVLGMDNSKVREGAGILKDLRYGPYAGG